MMVNSSSSEESTFDLEVNEWSNNGLLRKSQRNNRKPQNHSTMKSKNIGYYKWVRESEDSSCGQRRSSNCSKSIKPTVANSKSKNAKTEIKDGTDYYAEENSSESEEFVNCDCTVCQEVRFAEFQTHPRLKSCEAKVDITDDSKHTLVYKRKPVNPVIDRTVTKRLESAKRNAINGLKGQINCLELKIKELKKENATYKLLQYRQDKALTRYQGEFAELPTLIKNHKEELQGAKQLLRKAENKCRDLGETIKIRDKRIGKLQEENYKLSSFVNQYDMGNRYKLLRMLKDTKAKLRETEMKAEESAHNYQVLQKSNQQRARQINIRLKNADENLYKAHMRNLELRKYIEDQADRLRTYESLLVKTIRKNNLPLDMEEIQKGFLRNDNIIRRPRTYTLTYENQENKMICKKNDESLSQGPIKNQHSNGKASFDVVQGEMKSNYNKGCFNPGQGNMERHCNKGSFDIVEGQVSNSTNNTEEDDEPLDFEDDDEIATEILFAYHNIHDSESSQCPTGNCIGEFENNSNGKTEYGENSVQGLHTGKSGGDREILGKISSIAQENSCRKNRFDAGDKAESFLMSFSNSSATDEIKQDENGSFKRYEDYNFPGANYFQTAKETDENCMDSQKAVQLQNGNGRHPFFKISEEYVEKYVVDGNGRKKKSVTVMKKRKNAIFHPKNFPIENPSKSKIVQWNTDGVSGDFYKSKMIPIGTVPAPPVTGITNSDNNYCTLTSNPPAYSEPTFYNNNGRREKDKTIISASR